MPSEKLSQNSLDQETPITLGILNAVQENSGVTQRSVAQDLGIALGLANSYLKRCVRKGLIKVQQAPANRYRYYLTPKGFTEKSRLTAEYLSSSFNFYRKARIQCETLLAECAERRLHRVALAGVSELAEVVALCALEREVELAGVVDPTVRRERFAGVPVAAALTALGPVDGVIVTDVRRAQQTYDRLRQEHPQTPVLHPPLLGVVAGARRNAEDRP